MQRYLFYLIKYKYYLHIYEDSFGAKILRDDCALRMVPKNQQIVWYVPENSFSHRYPIPTLLVLYKVLLQFLYYTNSSKAKIRAIPEKKIAKKFIDFRGLT